MAEQATLKLQGRGFGISKPASSHLGSSLAGLGRCKSGNGISAAGPSGWPKRPLHRSEVRQMGHNSINKTAGRVDITSSVKYRISRARVGAVDV